MEVGYKDLREWILQAQELGALKVSKSNDLEEDVGRIAEVSSVSESGPALILDEFPGFDPGYRILLNPFGNTRLIALSFGFPVDSDRVTLFEHFKERLQGVDPIPPQYVESGPIFENRLVGDDVNLNRIPVPKWHKGDGGPYIGTGSLVITQDPDEKWVNLGTYRNQLHDEKTVGFYIAPAHHGWAHRDKYFSRGEPCPVAIVFGSDPLLFTSGMLELPWGASEYDWVGGWRGEPLKVIKGPITGIPIPANAEIVIEGFSYPDKVHNEGPFGEWTGYYASDRREQPYVDVRALYFRDNPILLGMPPQKPPYDADKARQYIKSALLVQELKQYGLPGITNAWCFGLGGCRLLVAVAIRQQYHGHSRQVGHATYASTVANFCGRYVVVVDEDIDVTDINDVIWAVLTRSDPATSIDIIGRTTTSPLDPRISPEAREEGCLYNSRAIIDATKPFEWIKKFPTPVRPDLKYRRESREKFGHLFEF